MPRFPAFSRRAAGVALGLTAALLVVGACAESSTAPRPDLSPASLTPVALSNDQTARAGSDVATPPAVTVRNAAGDPLAGITVTFAVASGGGSATGTTALTTATGIATVGSWTLGTTAGANTMTASVSGLGTTVTFSATGTAGDPVAITMEAGNNQSATVGTSVMTPLAVKIVDANGNGVAGFSVGFSANSGGGSITGSPSITDANGIATAGSWTLGLVAGVNTVVAFGPSSFVTFTATATAAAPVAVSIVAGNAQAAVAGSAVAVAPAVRVVDVFGNPVPGTDVTFAATGGGGNVTGSPAVTNSDGIATIGSWTLGPTVGTNTLTVTVAGVAMPATFAASGVEGPPATLVRVAGEGQSAPAGTAVPTAPAVRVADANGNPVPDVVVAFAVTVGNGTVMGSPATTNASGIASLTSWTLGTPGTNAVSATVSGLAPVVFTATSVAVPSSFTIVAGNNQVAAAGSRLPVDPALEVRDGNGDPIPGLPIVFRVSAGEGSLTADTVLTDAAGIAAVGWTLDTLPGFYFLYADHEGSERASFDAQAVPGPVARIEIDGDAQTGIVGQGLFPVTLFFYDQYSNLVSGVTPDITPSGNGEITSLNVLLQRTDFSWRLGTAAGAQTVTVRTAVGGPIIGVVHATATPDVPSVLVVTAGEGQTALQGEAVAIRPAVRVEDQYGNILPGVAVEFGTAQGGVVTGSPVVSDANGIATVGSWTLGAAGTNTLEAGTLVGTGYTVINATATLVIGSIEVTSGAGQVATAGTTVAIAPAVRVLDVLGNPVLGILVSFSPSGNGVATGSPVATGLGGIATLFSWRLATTPGENTLTITVPGFAGSVTVTATGT